MKSLPHGRPERIAVFAAVVLIPLAAQLVANAVWPILQQVDPDGAFLWITIHHLVMLALTLPALRLAFGLSLREAGFNLDNAATTVRWLTWFAVGCLGGVLLLHAPELLGDGRPHAGYPLTPRNVIATLGFQMLLSGTAEEPLFRGLVMTVLGRTWTRVFRVGWLEMPVTGLVATALFMLAHVRWTATAPFLEVSPVQQVVALGLGLFYAALFHRTKSLAGPILAHGCSNVALVGVRYLVAVL